MLEAMIFPFLVVVPWDHQFRPNPETRSLFVSLASEKIRRFFGPKKGKKSSRNNRWAIDLSGATPPKTNGYPLKIAGWFEMVPFQVTSVHFQEPSPIAISFMEGHIIWALRVWDLSRFGRCKFDSLGSFRWQWCQVHLVLLMVQKSD